ncbi:MAG: PPOX class F420-dependent oxidoreductase [Nitrososphaerota archaeon]|nr:PPOX class F420-dependent oxidoreductase [Nitrososphaerota archaeon]
MIGRGKEVRHRRVFSENEASYLAESFLGRLATASPEGEPHVVPVSYRFDGRTITFGGWNLTSSLKYRHLTANDRVAFVVDDVLSVDPWRVRGVEVRGRAEPMTVDGVSMVRIIPLEVRSFSGIITPTGELVFADNWDEAGSGSQNEEMT